MPDLLNDTQTSRTLEAHLFHRSSQKSFLIYNKHTNLNKTHFCLPWKQKLTRGLAALKLSPRLNLLWITTLELQTAQKRSEQ